MAILNIGATTWAQAAPEQWGTSDFGLDTLIVPMHGAESARVAYQNSLTKWSASSIDGNMFLAGWSGNDDRQYPRIDLRYIGCKGGTLPSVRYGISFSLAAANTSSTSPDAHGEFQFRAPTTTYDWIANAQPTDSPAYSAMATNLNPLDSLVSWNMTDSDGGSVDYSTFITLYNALTVSTQLANYEWDILVPNRYWHCSSTIIRTLIGN